MKGQQKGGDAELLFEKWLAWRRLDYARSGIRGKFQRQDFFGCLDFIVIERANELSQVGSPMLSTWAVQVTTHGTGAVSDRRRKLEKAETRFPADWRKSIVLHVRTQDPANFSKWRDHWRVQDLQDGAWLPAVAVEFDRAAVEEAWLAEKRESDAEELAALKKRADESAAAVFGDGGKKT